MGVEDNLAVLPSEHLSRHRCPVDVSFSVTIARLNPKSTPAEIRTREQQVVVVTICGVLVQWLLYVPEESNRREYPSWKVVGHQPCQELCSEGKSIKVASEPSPVLVDKGT